MNKPERILIVDTLRGFALLLIVLIHYVEHFDFFKQPEVNFLFSPEINSKVMSAMFLLISGKAYSIFALLFGLSFFIQMDRKENDGIDFRGRFLWRISILLIFGFLHSLIYRGDILHIYAMLAVPLIFLYKVRTKALLCIALLLVIQIPVIYQLILTLIDSDYEFVKSFKGYFREGNTVYASGSLADVMSYNFWKGRMTVWSWTYYNGRYLQLLTLFIIGMILGRKRIFEKLSDYRKSTVKVLFTSCIVFFVIFVIQGVVKGGELSSLQKRLVNILLSSYGNLAITSFFVSLIILIYLKFQNAYIFRLFASYGKMSLSNYIFQAVFGVVFFYGFGFSMYKYLGSAWSLILAFLIFYLQALISMYWNKRYYYGPLEWLWRCLTYLDFKTKFKRDKE